ncbi:hypothetical protein AB1J06_25745 [Agrobacterium tumefaciens]|uniref:hypothetical protein n=1 Tax=Agrobacterium tumefaciens TaxID=358 RepID=UPI0013AF09BE
MINLHERLSEYSYGYGVTRETQGLLESVGLRPTPFLPNLLHEADLGFDVGFKDQGKVVVLQFKLGHELKRFHRSQPAQPIPLLSRPFWRFDVDTTAHQFQRLEEFEASGADTYYVAPKFSSWWEFDRAFQNDEILERSLLQKPSEITAAIATTGGSPGHHRVVYDRSRQHVCSEPAALKARNSQEFAREISESIEKAGVTLEQSLEMLFERDGSVAGPGRLNAARRDQIMGRFKSREIAMAAVVGVEAWSQGAQIIYVTNPSSDQAD